MRGFPGESVGGCLYRPAKLNFPLGLKHVVNPKGHYSKTKDKGRMTKPGSYRLSSIVVPAGYYKVLQQCRLREFALHA